VTLLPTGRSRVIKKFSSRSQSKTSWPPLCYIDQSPVAVGNVQQTYIGIRHVRVQHHSEKLYSRKMCLENKFWFRRLWCS